MAGKKKIQHLTPEERLGAIGSRNEFFGNVPAILLDQMHRHNLPVPVIDLDDSDASGAAVGFDFETTQRSAAKALAWSQTTITRNEPYLETRDGVLRPRADGSTRGARMDLMTVDEDGNQVNALELKMFSFDRAREAHISLRMPTVYACAIRLAERLPDQQHPALAAIPPLLAKYKRTAKLMRQGRAGEKALKTVKKDAVAALRRLLHVARAHGSGQPLFLVTPEKAAGGEIHDDMIGLTLLTDDALCELLLRLDLLHEPKTEAKRLRSPIGVLLQALSDYADGSGINPQQFGSSEISITMAGNRIIDAGAGDMLETPMKRLIVDRVTQDADLEAGDAHTRAIRNREAYVAHNLLRAPANTGLLAEDVGAFEQRMPCYCEEVQAANRCWIGQLRSYAGTLDDVDTRQLHRDLTDAEAWCEPRATLAEQLTAVTVLPLLLDAIVSRLVDDPSVMTAGFADDVSVLSDLIASQTEEAADLVQIALAHINEHELSEPYQLLYDRAVSCARVDYIDHACRGLAGSSAALAAAYTVLTTPELQDSSTHWSEMFHVARVYAARSAPRGVHDPFTQPMSIIPTDLSSVLYRHAFSHTKGRARVVTHPQLGLFFSESAYRHMTLPGALESRSAVYMHKGITWGLRRQYVYDEQESLRALAQQISDAATAADIELVARSSRGVLPMGAHVDADISEALTAALARSVHTENDRADYAMLQSADPFAVVLRSWQIDPTDVVRGRLHRLLVQAETVWGTRDATDPADQRLHRRLLTELGLRDDVTIDLLAQAVVDHARAELTEQVAEPSLSPSLSPSPSLL